MRPQLHSLCSRLCFGLAAFLVCAWPLACSTADGEPARPRNVVLFLVDTLRADRLGCYGYPRDTSPNLDRLAARGTLYEENRSQSCWTVPSMISLMSGLYVTEREARTPEVPLLAERLQEAGLDTAAFIGNETLVDERGFQRGFRTFEVTAGEGDADELVGFFERWHSSRPARDDRGFFAWIHPLDPHHPYAPPDGHHVFHGEEIVGEPALQTLWGEAQERARVWAAPDEPMALATGAKKIRALNNRYDGEVRAADAALGRLLAYLEERGELDDTLIVFASDHGEKLWEHERYEGELEHRRDRLGPLREGVVETFGCGHKAWFHEELWRTPLVFAGPGFPAGVRQAGLAANLDIAPSVLDVLGLLDASSELTGESLLGGKPPKRERVFAYGFETTASVDRTGHKLIEHAVRYFGDSRGPEPTELFDLTRDADERSDLAPRESERVQELRAAHAKWRAEHDRDVDTTESDAARDALRKLGYLDEE